MHVNDCIRVLLPETRKICTEDTVGGGREKDNGDSEIPRPTR